MNRKTVIALIILVSVSCLSCVHAMDLNDTDSDLSLNQYDNGILNASSNSQPVEASSQNDDTPLTSDVKSDSGSDVSFLVLDNDADKENIQIGEYLTWIVTVDNQGPGTAKNVRVLDQWSDGLKYIGHTASKGTFNPKTGMWDIGDMLANSSEYLYIKTLAVSVGEKINKATLISDSVNLNNETFEEEEIDVFDDDKDSVKHHKTVHAKTMHATGNPIFLILIALFGCLVAYVKR